VLLLCAAPAQAERRALETILQDDAQLLHGDDASVRGALETIRELGVDRVRLTAGWSVLTRDADAATRPADFDATDPAAYEQQRWRELDRAVRLAQELGLRVMIDVGFWAPAWAARDAGAGRARSEVDPAAFADFAVAVSRRYSGTFEPPRGLSAALAPARDEAFLDGLLGGGAPSSSAPPPPPGPLPRVDLLTLWNEPNHPGFLRPQWRQAGGRTVAWSPHLYRAMVVRAYPAVKAAQPAVKVLVGATAALGDHTGRGVNGVPPLRFVREFACVDRRLRPRRTGACRGFERVPGDGWSHHPYSLDVVPATRSMRGRDNARIGELDRLTRLLGRLATRGRLARPLRNVYVTEYGYETRTQRFAPRDQARFLTWAEYLAWRNPRVRTFAQFLLRDVPRGSGGSTRRRALGQWESGLLFADGRPKPAALSFRAGLHAEQRAGGVRLWGRVRGADIVRGWIETQDGRRWHRIATRPESGGEAETTFLVRRGDVVDRVTGRGTRWRLVVRTPGGRATTSVPVAAV
jgi:hypothetical protein